jgi:endonuclease G
MKFKLLILLTVVFSTSFTYNTKDYTCYNQPIDPILMHSCIPNSDRIIIHEYYTLCYNKEYRIPNWVCYKLTSAMSKTDICERKNDFRKDSLEPLSDVVKDYIKSGYDKGHMCPSEDMRFSVKAESQTFYMTNMCPQLGHFNRGIYKVLEEWSRIKAEKNDSLYITSGSIMSTNPMTIGHNKVGVPEYFYKILVDNAGPEIKGIGFILKQNNATGDLDTFVVTIDYLEHITGIDFHPALPDNIENEIESNSDFDKW